MQKVATNFKYPVIRETDYVFGSEQIKGTVLREDGDWRDFLPQGEEQRRHGIESSTCFIQAQQHAIATLLEEQFGIIDSNFSERFNLTQIHDVSEQGGSPIDAGDSFRHDGLIDDSLLPFSEDIASWKEFNSFKNGSAVECIKKGQEWLREWSPKYDIVFKREELVEQKYNKLKDALRYSPVPVSVYAWKQENDLYVKPQGVSDNHLVLCVFVDENNSAYVFDTYSPFIKRLEPNFNMEFGVRWSIEKNTSKKKENWLLDILKRLFNI